MSLELVGSWPESKHHWQERWYRGADFCVSVAIRWAGERIDGVRVDRAHARFEVWEEMNERPLHKWPRGRPEGQRAIRWWTEPLGLERGAFTPAERRRFWGSIERRLMRHALEAGE